jgi:UDP-N-acetylmuramoyl-L-alanyl-D-glutamate--2,6-diaminopimelate ligase
LEPRSIRELLSGLSVHAESGVDVSVSGLAYRADRVAPGDAFFCIKGLRADGHDFAADAVDRGAAALVCEMPITLAGSVPVFVVDDTRAALAHAADAYFGHPSSRLGVVGITGTNGKTTTTYLLDSIVRASGRRCAIIGTTGIGIEGRMLDSAHTTPESLDLQALFASMLAEGVDSVAMEVSSHAIDLHRVDATRFAVAAFTNLTQDHLDYHGTLGEYFAVKRRLFTDFEVGVKVVNIDDPLGAQMASELGADYTVGRAPEANVRALAEDLRDDGSGFTLLTETGSADVRLPLAGAFNVSNALVAAACALGLGIGLDDIVGGLETAPQVPGRLERVECGQPFSVVVDYAHTPDSLEKALTSLRDVTEGRLISVFGCGGDRDPEKRPIMGAASGTHADLSIVTSDNPRTEDPVGIILQVEDGLRQSGGLYEVEVDRRRAIQRALGLAQPGDCVIIAGKGHEDYQIFADRTVHFDDREVVREVLGC